MELQKRLHSWVSGYSRLGMVFSCHFASWDLAPMLSYPFYSVLVRLLFIGILSSWSRGWPEPSRAQEF